MTPIEPPHPGIIGATILTHGGTYFDYANPERSVVDIEDIAYALSNLCRYTGHPKRFYSVAEHSVRASYVEEDIEPFAKLMHDAAEYVMGDMNSPLKQLCPDYKAIEKRVEATIAARFGLKTPWSKAVKRADYIMLSTEKRDITSGAGHVWPGLAEFPPLPGRIIPWTPQVARKRFLERFAELTR